MYKIITYLCLFSVDYQTGKKYVLLTPSKKVPSFDDFDDGSLILPNLTNLDLNWVNPQICLTSQEKHDTIKLYYGAVIPYDSNVYNNKWAELLECSDFSCFQDLIDTYNRLKI